MRKNIFFALFWLGTICMLPGCSKKEDISRVPDICPAPTSDVDLGLLSEVIWSSYNLGADSLFQLGDSFSGNDVSTLNYPYWRVPSAAEWAELIDACDWEWVESRHGFLVTSKTSGYEGHSIFLPANQNSFEARYWASTPYKIDSKYYLANLYVRYDDVRDRMVPPIIEKSKLSEYCSVRMVRAGSGRSTTCRYVNLGLTSGLNWGKRNIGEVSDLSVGPEHYGDYFSWGDTSTYYTNWNGDGRQPPSSEQWKAMYRAEGYTWSNYRFIQNFIAGGTGWPTKENFTKYNDSTLPVLEPADDVATHRLGSGWRMPTKNEFEDLYNQCYWVWTGNYSGTGVSGYIVYKSQDKTVDRRTIKESLYTYSVGKDPYIFLPAAGCLVGKDLGGSNTDGYYWSSSLDVDSIYAAHGLTFDNSQVDFIDFHPFPGLRFYGQSVRPVYVGNRAKISPR